MERQQGWRRLLFSKVMSAILPIWSWIGWPLSEGDYMSRMQSATQELAEWLASLSDGCFPA